MSGEQDNVRHDDKKSLHDLMSRTGQLPSANGKPYAPYIMVDHAGTPWVNEGNHRIMVAHDLGWKYLPVEVKYFTGGEAENGPLHPHKIEAMDREAHAAGFLATNFSGGSTSNKE